MTPPIDQSSLTAYALGELSGAERAAVAAHLVGNAKARRYVAEVRATAHLLVDELARESFGGLTDLQHAAIEHKLADSMRMSNHRPKISRVARWNRTVFALSLAASITIVFGVVSLLMPLVYRHVDSVAGQHGKPADTSPNPNVIPFHYLPGGPGLAAEAPSHNKFFSAEDPYSPDSEEPFVTDVPNPDNRLATDGSGHEEMTPPPPAISPGTPEKIDPPHREAVAQGTGNPPADTHTVAPKAPENPVGPKAPKVNKEDFASVPPNAVSPDKVHNTVERSPNGTLPNGEQYAHLLENPFIDSAVNAISGFSAGVDTASYSNIRRFLTHGTLPPRDAVRIEEMLNYFPIRSANLPGDGALVLQVELGACPWRPERRLARVCLQARELPPAARPPANIVFIIDISDSMRKEKTKLPLLKSAIRRMVAGLTVSDRVALVAYSHETEVILPPTAADAKDTIYLALDRLTLGHQSAGGQGLEVAYDLASRNMVRSGINRIVLATDGNWDIGATDHDKLAAVVAEGARRKISLTVLGVGMDNLKDANLQKLAAAGNGSYAYIDTLNEARKVLDDQVSGAMIPVARDVKVQVSFNPASAGSYRLLGYERRALSNEELKSQSRPGGELGAGQSVTALYEVIPVGKNPVARPIDMLTATVTYAEPANGKRQSLIAVGEDHATPLPRTSSEFRFAAAVAEFGLLLRNSDYKGNTTSYGTVLDHVRESTFGPDESGYRREFANLVQLARTLRPDK